MFSTFILDRHLEKLWKEGLQERLGGGWLGQLPPNVLRGSASVLDSANVFCFRLLQPRQKRATTAATLRLPP